MWKWYDNTESYEPKLTIDGPITILKKKKEEFSSLRVKTGKSRSETQAIKY